MGNTEAIKTKKASSLIVIVLFFSSFVGVVSAVTTTKTVSASTGEIDVAAGIKIELSCTYNVGFTSPDEIQPGETSDLLLNLNSGSWNIRVYIPSPIDEWFSRELEITSSGPISIISGLSINLDISPVTTLEVLGPADLESYEVNWGQSLFTRQIRVTCHRNTPHGTSITINSNYALDLSVGINIELPLFRQNIATFDLTRLQLTPKISSSIEVSSFIGGMISFITSPLGIIMGAILFLVLLIIFAAYKGKKRHDSLSKKEVKSQRRLDSTKQQIIPKQMKYCIHCGEKLPDNATFCGNCGKPRK